MCIIELWMGRLRYTTIQKPIYHANFGAAVAISGTSRSEKDKPFNDREHDAKTSRNGQGFNMLLVVYVSTW